MINNDLIKYMSKTDISVESLLEHFENSSQAQIDGVFFIGFSIELILALYFSRDLKISENRTKFPLPIFKLDDTNFVTLQDSKCLEIINIISLIISLFHYY